MTDAVRRATLGQHTALFARGVAMGLAEIVPGVSGGTIAFITGIYDELVRALASLSSALSTPASRAPWRNGWSAFVRRHNLPFLAVLTAGMATGAAGLAHLMLALLETQPGLVAGFFFGLIAASVVHVATSSSWRWLATLGVVGLVLGLLMGFYAGSATVVGTTPATVFVGGALAATAWMLPGVSGAFVLLLMGLYKPMLEAFTAFDLALLAPFAAGLAIGLLAFSRLLAWLLAKARRAVLALLTGFMAGSLTELWPWGRGAEHVHMLGVVAVMVAGATVVGILAYVARAART
ncbi:MAG: DUF368 domain-containing protein [Gammaproteobacteria bacterium]|nr:DUF368 domain-containing protein [Gammaproteobacteria bacterium]